MDEENQRSPLYRKFSIELKGSNPYPEIGTELASGVQLVTTRGIIPCLFHEPASSQVAALMVPGARGGFEGPANGLYAELGDRLSREGIAALRLNYRKAGNLDECTLDALASVWHLANCGYKRVVVIGHSFGGAVAIGTARYSTHVRAVVAMSSQSYGAEDVVLLAPRPLLLVHGDRDEVIPLDTTHTIYNWASEPKQLEVFAGAEHGLRECRDEVFELLLNWIPNAILS